MERNIAQGDSEISFGTHIGTTITTDATYYPPLWRGQASAELRDYDKAISETTRSVALAQASPEQGKKSSFTGKPPQAPLEKLKGQALLGVLYASLGQRDKAREFVEVIEKFETDAPEANLRSAAIADRRKALKAGLLAKMYLAMGDFEQAYKASQYEASSYISWSEQMFTGEEGEAPATSYRIPTNYVRYKSAYETKRKDEAKQGYDALLKHPRIKSFGELYWMILFDRGRIEEDFGNRKSAIPYYTQAVEIIEQQRSTINSEVNKIGFVGDKQQVYHHLVSALLAQGQVAQAFEYVERAKARALVDLLASKKDFAAPSGGPQQVAALIKDLDTADADAVVQDLDSASAEGAKMRSARGVQVRRQLKTAAPELAALVTVTQTSTNEVQTLLRPGEVLLEYYYEGDDLIVFVLDRTQIRGVKLAGAGLVQDITDFRKALEDSKSDRYRAVSNKLHDRLIASVPPS
jgi:tetratricopeptide (TPR) repeat protein